MNQESESSIVKVQTSTSPQSLALKDVGFLMLASHPVSDLLRMSCDTESSGSGRASDKHALSASRTDASFQLHTDMKLFTEKNRAFMTITALLTLLLRLFWG